MGSHDTLFKLAIRNPSAALAIVRAALPAELFAALDPETIRVSDGNFVNERLRERFADALLEVKSHGEPTLIYLLFEHKSQAERFTVLDLVDGVVRIWQSWRRNQEAGNSLPRIIPIVFHHANAEWDQPKDLRELLAGDADLARAFATHDPSFPVLFFDLGGVDDPEAAIAGIDDPYAQCVIFVMIVARLRNFMQHMKRRGYALISATLRLPNGEALVQPVLHYVFEVAPADIDPVEFVDVSSQYLDPQAEKVMKTMKDVLLEQGAAKGRKEGEERGRQEGLAEGAIAGRCEGEALAILTVLGSRLPGDVNRVRDHLFAIRDHSRLLELLVIATKVDSIEAFERELAKD